MEQNLVFPMGFRIVIYQAGGISFLYSRQLFGNFIFEHLHTLAYNNNGKNALLF
jgi:hypothetical protein